MNHPSRKKTVEFLCSILVFILELVEILLLPAGTTIRVIKIIVICTRKVGAEIQRREFEISK